MIYVKMVLRNVKRSSKDYLVYFLTLVLCVALFYSFLSISSKYYHPNIGASYNISMLGSQMKAVIVLITSLLIFLVHYVNSFMVRRKQKEFALQTIMGMERRTTAFLFFSETFVIGITALLFGLLLGSILAQGITALLLSAYGKPYTFVFSLLPDTAFISLLFFCVLFLAAGLLNTHTIQKIKVIDMLKANQKVESKTKYDIWMTGWLLFMCLTAAVQLIESIGIYKLLNDNRSMFIIKILQFGNLAFPFLLLLAAGFGAIVKKTKKQRFLFLLAVTVLSVLMIVSSLGMIAAKQTYFLPIESNQINIFLLCAGGSFLFCICMFFFFAHRVIEHIKTASIKIRYHKENLFLFGQLTSKLKTNARTMTVISISLCFAILFCILSPIISSWISGFAEKRDIFDIQAGSSYNKVEKTEVLQENNFELIESYAQENSILFSDALSFHTYFTEKDDFYNRYKYDFPVLAMAVSDYNHLLQMSGKPPISLGKECFTTQWHSTAAKKDKDNFLKTYPTLTINETELTAAENQSFSADLGEEIYNSYTNVLFIVPDSVCKPELIANTYFYANIAGEFHFKAAESLETYFYEKTAKQDEGTGNTSEVRIKVLQSNQSIAYSFLARTILLYAGIVLLVICFTVLSVKQLADASDFAYRYQILRKIGTSQKDIYRIGLQQMLIWFGLPIIIAICSAAALFIYFIMSNQSALAAFVNVRALTWNILRVCAILAILVTAYFSFTWIMFRRSIK